MHPSGARVPLSPQGLDEVLEHVLLFLSCCYVCDLVLLSGLGLTRGLLVYYPFFANLGVAAQMHPSEARVALSPQGVREVLEAVLLVLLLLHTATYCYYYYTIRPCGREDASSVVTAGATADTTKGNGRASRESGCCVHIHTGNL